MYRPPLISFTGMDDKFEDMFDFYLSESIRSTMKEREYEIVCMRLGILDDEPKTLQETGDEFGLSRERIRQIEVKFYKKIKFHYLNVLEKPETQPAVTNLYSLLSIWVPSEESTNPYYIALLLHRLDKVQYLKLFTSLFYPSIKGDQREKEVRNFLNKILHEQNQFKKYNEDQLKKFNKLFKDVAWPEKPKSIDITKLKLIKPKRFINLENNFIGSFFSEKNQCNIEYESNLEYKFCMYLEHLNDVIGYVPQPVKIPYTINGIQRNYYPDFLVAFANGRCVLVEIKPRTHMAHYKNLLKFEALQRYCIEKGLGYLIAENYSSINKLINYEVDENQLESLISKLEKYPLNWSKYKVIREELSISTFETNALILHGDLKLTILPYSISFSGVSFQKFIELHRSMTGFLTKKDKEKKEGITLQPDKINKERVAIKNQERGRPLNDYTRWTKEEEERLKKRYKDGMTLEQLSSVHRRGKKSVGNRLFKLNIIDNRGSVENLGMNSNVNGGNSLSNNFVKSSDLKEFTLKPNDEKISNRNKQLGLPMNSHSKWTLAEEKLLINRFNDGLTITQISKIHGRNAGGISSRLKKLGLIQ